MKHQHGHVVEVENRLHVVRQLSVTPEEEKEDTAMEDDRVGNDSQDGKIEISVIDQMKVKNILKYQFYPTAKI